MKPYSVASLRRTLADLGWSAAALDAKVEQARASVETMDLVQIEMEVAA